VAFDASEQEMRGRMRAFVAGHEDCFRRSLLIGHITSSCWIVDPERGRTLLTWHKRLNRWLQMGGHVEVDDATLLDSALREAREESGIEHVRPVSREIFDLDIHPIPARRNEPEHLHYDVRFLFEADPSAGLIVSPESREVLWVDLGEVVERNPDASMRRMVAKTGFR
jgi:8-oxo-dGTP pyrophosphatase MutT (NUDIX family)